MKVDPADPISVESKGPNPIDPYDEDWYGDDPYGVPVPTVVPA